MAKNKTMARPIRMDNKTWNMAEKLANARMPVESRPAFINRLIWEEAERCGRKVGTQSAEVESAVEEPVQSAVPQSAPDLPSTGEGNQSAVSSAEGVSDADLEWED